MTAEVTSQKIKDKSKKKIPINKFRGFVRASRSRLLRGRIFSRAFSLEKIFLLFFINLGALNPFYFFFLLTFDSCEFASCFMPTAAFGGKLPPKTCLGNPSTALAHFLLLPCSVKISDCSNLLIEYKRPKLIVNVKKGTIITGYAALRARWGNQAMGRWGKEK
jgi:hypothetical protein